MIRCCNQNIQVVDQREIKANKGDYLINKSCKQENQVQLSNFSGLNPGTFFPKYFFNPISQISPLVVQQEAKFKLARNAVQHQLKNQKPLKNLDKGVQKLTGEKSACQNQKNDIKNHKDESKCYFQFAQKLKTMTTYQDEMFICFLSAVIFLSFLLKNLASPSFHVF